MAGPTARSDNAAADCLGIANDATEFELWISEHILHGVFLVLADPDGYSWERDRAEEYVEVIVEIAEASGGGWIKEPPRRANDSVDYEDNLILDLAWEAEANLIVSSDHHLIELSPWRNRPILRPSEFADRSMLAAVPRGGASNSIAHRMCCRPLAPSPPSHRKLLTHPRIAESARPPRPRSHTRIFEAGQPSALPS